jgi:L,D-peptidoglycan transpeptidase YkuD (ErfK/YbiS/YcfS/YnhG family)
MIDTLCYKGSPPMASSCNPWNQSRPITNAPYRKIIVRHLPGYPQLGRLTVGAQTFRCALGKTGLTHTKKEGDGATPIGSFQLRRLWYRKDAGMRPRCRLPLRVIQQDDGWCDTPKHRSYNKPIKLPFSQSHERMWRNDDVYNLVLEINWNDGPVVAGKGSAIFFHLARPGFPPTEGCVAINLTAMRKILPRIGPRTRFDIA